MLQSGIRAAMAVEVKGPDLASIQQASDAIEGLLRDVEAISPSTVVADRIVAKPYLEIEIDRKKAAQYGLDVQAVQEVIETALGGKAITTTVEGRERYPVRVRYMRELRDDFTSLAAILVATPEGVQVPLGQVAEFRYTPGPSVIKTEDSFLVGYVLFDKKRDYTEVDAVEQARAYLGSMAEAGFLELPAGVSYSFTGAYENQVRAEKRLMFILPLTLALILIILYLQFGRISTSMLVFSGVAVAWAGGFVMIWLFAQPWFFDLSLFGVNMRDLFQMHGINMSIPVWVGFLALFGIATDDGVVMASYLDERFSVLKPQTRAQVRDAVVEAGMMRIRPCMMTTATTILALIPVLTSTGRGSDLMVPMAIPTFGGMAFAVITIFVVPAAYCWLRERELGKGDEDEG
jgi:Cu(I)/Ag(I) efflux system membrane protein CusA/SilA